MNLTIGSTTIVATECTRRRDPRQGFYLEITIPKDSIGMDELYGLLNECKESIVVTEDNGTENTYVGFRTLANFSYEKGSYKVTQVCTSEYEAQLSLANSRLTEQSVIIAAQEAEIKSLNEKSAQQDAIIESQLQSIAALNGTSKTQAEELVALNSTIKTQSATIAAQAEEIELLNGTLLEVLMG